MCDVNKALLLLLPDHEGVSITVCFVHISMAYGGIATARAAMHAEVAVLTAQYACNSHAYEEQLWCQ